MRARPLSAAGNDLVGLGEVLGEVAGNAIPGLDNADIHDGATCQLRPPSAQLALWDVSAIDGEVQVWVPDFGQLYDSYVASCAGALSSLDALPDETPGGGQKVKPLRRRKARVNPHG